MSLPIVCIAGGGTAGLEALLSARELLGDRVELRLISPEREFCYRAMQFARPLVPAPERVLPIADLVAEAGAALVHDRVVEVREADRTLLTRDGDLVGFDYLLLATGARGERVLEQGQVWERGRDPVVLDETLEGLASSRAIRAGVLIPRGARWPLPAYELALVMGWTAAAAGQVTLITAEERPLDVLGGAASEMIAGVLSDAGVELITGVEAFDGGHDAAGTSAAQLRLLTEEPAASDGDALTARPTRRPSEA
jgi:NADPH-dependent 2,4-dienoyl-CoA reductase/sulfur reductase-like enzyme